MDSIRIGAVVNGSKIPAWHYTLLEEICASNHYDLVVVMVITPKIKLSQTLGAKLLQKWQTFDTRKLRPNASAFKNVSEISENTECIPIAPLREGKGFNLEGKELSQLRECQLDVLLNLNPFWGPLNALEFPKCGVWHYFHGDYRSQRNNEPGHQELLHQAAYSGTFLLRLRPAPQDHEVLYNSYAYVDKISLGRTLQNTQWKAIAFVLRKLKELQRYGPEEFLARTTRNNSDLSFYYHPKHPKPYSLMALTLRQIIGTIKKKIREKFILEKWILLFDRGEGPATDLSKYQKIIPPKDRFWADPFLYYKNNKHYIFVEEVINKKKGHIAVIEVDQQGNYQKPTKVLDRPYHLSYPYILEWKDDVYMIPESSGNNSIEVYKSTNFPNGWELHKTLMTEVQAADTTLFFYNDTWWMFTNIRNYRGYPNWDELHLFYADDPFSETWTPHPLNPIVSDVRVARPAGKIFEWQGKIYRPSQNCSNRYGYGLKFNQIEKLSENEYGEREVTSVEPLWEDDIKTVHTFNFEQGLSVVDAKLKRSKI